MLIRQSKNSFIRLYDEGQIGYITNQLTKHDRTYDENGAIFLAQITRQPKTIEKCVNNLTSIFTDVNRQILSKDFNDFACDLAEHFFVVMGESDEELDTKDISFSYSMQ